MYINSSADWKLSQALRHDFTSPTAGAICTGPMGATDARLSLRPPFEGGTVLMQTSGGQRRENAKSCLNVIARSESDEAIHSCSCVATWIASLRLQ
jgi:hypothetical protein